MIDLHGWIEGLEREIAAQRSAVNHMEGRALLLGTASIASLAGAGGLGYLAYGEFQTIRDLEAEMKGMDRSSDEYGQARSDLSDATRSAIIYGVGALAGLYLTRHASRKRAAHRDEAARLRAPLRDLEQQRQLHRSRIDQVLTAQIAVVPHLRDGWGGRTRD